MIKKVLKVLLRPFWPFLESLIIRILSIKSLSVVQNTQNIDDYRTYLLSNIDIHTIIECGSGVGDYVSKFNNSNNNYIIHCIDPYHLSIEQLKIRLKNENNCHFYNAGILNVPGIQNLIIYGIPEGNSFFELNEKVVPYLREIEKIEISCLKMDSFIKKNKLKNQILLHVDANGSEYSILSSAKENLEKKHFKLIELETVLPNVYKTNNQDSISSCISLLNKYGYNLLKTYIEPVSYTLSKQIFFFDCR